ncbi:MAG: hypothetical protein JO134_03735 [Xanthobacteraceae bacterium]|nr:hypothetical protein [Xanthobacteraceae bacterium]
MRGFPLLFHRNRSLRATRLYVGAQAVCAVTLGARVERMQVGRIAGTRRCDIAGFDALPLFSKLIICLVGRTIKTKTATAIDDRRELARARDLAAASSPSQHEADRLLRLAAQEAERIIGERWGAVSHLASLLERRKPVSADRIARIVYRPARSRAAVGAGQTSAWFGLQREVAEARDILVHAFEVSRTFAARAFAGKRGGKGAADSL